MATDGITEINLSNAAVIGNNDINNWNGGFFLRREVGVSSALSGLQWNDISSQANANVGEGDRRNLVKYVSPTLHGFTFSASWGEDDFGDAALRYAAEFNNVRVAAGIGYQQWTDGNAFDPRNPGAGSQGDRGCADLQRVSSRNDADVDCNALGLSGSLMHVPTGFYVAAAYGSLEDENREKLVAGTTVATAFFNTEKPEDATQVTRVTSSFNAKDFDDEDQHWYLQAGVERNFFGIGKSTFYGEVFKGETGAGLNVGALRILAGTDPFSIGVGTAIDDTAIADSEVDAWGIGFVQSIDAAAMDLYIGFRNYSAEVTSVSADRTTKVFRIDTDANGGKTEVDITPVGTVTARGQRRTLDVEDFQAVMAGGIIRF
jgi:hypothetical protein